MTGEQVPTAVSASSDPWKQRLGVWWIAEDQPDLPAIIASPDGLRSYGELAGSAHQLVHTFRSLGAAVGDSVAAMLPNGVSIIEVSLACQEAGLLFIPLNNHLTAIELATIMEHSGAKVLIIDAAFASALSDLDAQKIDAHVLSVGAIPGIDALSRIRAEHPTTMPNDRTPGGLFVYTSGTTGKPKGIRRKLEEGDPSIAANAAAVFGRAFDFLPFDGPMLVSTGMFHGGSHAFYIGGLHVGHALVITAKFDAEESLRLIHEHRVRSAYMVPTQFNRFLRLPEETKSAYDVSSLHAVIHSAAPCPRDVKQQMMDWWGPVIWETYGGMEGPATIAKPPRWLEKPGTVGRAIKGVRLSILDDNDNELGAGEIGNIYMENEVGFSYHADAEGTKSAFRGKRFTLGDIGYLDADGYLFISDRAKDMIITGGTNVYPAEVEAVLIGHPLVADVAVIGLPDADWGESVKAVVQLAVGTTPNDKLAQELIAFCKANLASYKCPRSVDFRETLPRTEAGKLYKRKLRDEYLAISQTS
jgi:long-chain acyl-CoA synthetase